MPTPVSSARQCLTPEAAYALDEAVAVARRRGHAQTMSLHAVSALFSVPNSSLREACARARNSAYSPRLQFKALELSLSASLDRIPTARPQVDEPPVSNSLMAAIKRSQANQKRHPEDYHVYHQIRLQQQSGSAVSCIKVELQHLILAMLDDPVVSRVFGEAGFRSCDIKMAVIRPLPQFIGYSRSKVPPLFLSNINKDASFGVGNLDFHFRASGGLVDADESRKRICEVLVRNKGRNPLLVGVCASHALKSFTGSFEQKNQISFPADLYGLTTVCIENEVSKFGLKNCIDDELLNLRLEEIAEMADGANGHRLIVDIGDLQNLILEHAPLDSLNDVIKRVTKLLATHVGKLWLIASVASYEMYLKFVAKFPSIENDWDLQLLPTTDVRSSSAAEPYSSLMESFVPFGGFFSTPGIKCSINSIHRDMSHGHLPESKFVKEETINLNRRLLSSVTGQQSSSLPARSKVAGLSTNKHLESLKTISEEACLIPLVAGIPEKLDGNFPCLQQAFPHDVTQVCHPVPAESGFYIPEDMKTAENDSGILAYANSFSSLDFELISMPNKIVSAPASLESSKSSLLTKLFEKPTKLQHPRYPDFISSRKESYTNCTFAGHSSSSSPSSVTTNLGLGIIPSPNRESEINQIGLGLVGGRSGCFTCKFDNVAEVSHRSTQQSLFSSSNSPGHHDYEKFKMLFRALSERVPLQREAVSLISRIITGSQIASPRGGIWLGFLGPDSRSKKKIAAVLSEILWKEHGRIVCTDLSSCHSLISAFSKDHRGKTIVDSIAEALSRNPFSVVLLENVDKADVLVQSTLSRAIKTGKLSDSYGRDVSISNAIFVATSGFINDDKCPSHLKEPTNLSETKIFKAKGQAFQMIHEQISHRTSRTTSDQTPTNKRKLVGVDMSAGVQLESFKRAFKQLFNTQLDLNLPADVDDDTDEVTDCQTSDGKNHGQSPKSWLEDFMDQVDGIVEFKPFDTEGISEELVRKMTDKFHNVVGSDHLLEIHADVMDQVLAVVYTSDHPGIAEDWINSVLSKRFTEAKTRYDFTSPSVIKLATCNQVYTVESVPFLPPSIIFN